MYNVLNSSYVRSSSCCTNIFFKFRTFMFKYLSLFWHFVSKFSSKHAIVNSREFVNFQDPMFPNKLKKSSPSVMIKKDLDDKRQRNWILYQGKISFEKSRYYEEWKRNIFFSSKNKMSSKLDIPLNFV